MLLAAYPPPFRQRFAGEMIELFVARCRAARSRRARLRFWLGVCGDLVRSVPAEWMAVRAARRAVGPRQAAPHRTGDATRVGTVVSNLLFDGLDAARRIRRSPVLSTVIVGLMALMHAQAL